MVNGEDGQAWYGLAVVERARGNLAQARRAARNAARFEKDKLASYLMLGTLSLDVGDAAEARAAFTRALPLEPGQRRARLGLGWSYLIQDDFSHAATEWRRVIDGANDPLTLSRMLFVFRQVGDAEAVQLVSERLARLGVRP
jgi:Flp pilus assembly protein TadD